MLTADDETLSTLRSDYVPDNTEYSKIRNSISTFEISMNDINSKLTDLQAQMQVLKEEERRIERELFLRRALVAPVRKLVRVPEVLAEIFEYCLEDAPSFSGERTPLLLTHICRHWSDLAKTCPRLWTQITIPHHADSSENVPLATWLERSGHLPLDLSIRATGRPIILGDEEPQPESQIGDRLVECKRLCIVDYRGGYLVSRLPISKPSRWSSLQTLVLKCTNRPFDGLKTQENIWELPCLKTLELLNSPFIISAIRFPLPQLRDFRMTATTIPHDVIPYRIWRKFFTTCTSLELVHIHMVYLSYSDTADEQDRTGDFDTITWSHLRRLKVYLPQKCHRKDLDFLLTLFSPKLEYLQIDGYRWVDGFSVFNAIYNVISNCHHSLQRLTMKSVDFSIDEAIQILKLCENVSRMKLSSKVILRALIPDRGSQPEEWLCPKLQRLKFIYDSAASMDFLELVERRSAPEDLRYRTTTFPVQFLERVEVHVRDPGAWTVVGGLLGRIKRFRRARPDVPVLGLDRYMDEADEE